MANDADQTKAIFMAAVEKYAPEQWSAFLDGACGDDAALRQRVEQLLQSHVDMGSIQTSADVPTIDHPAPEKPGTQIGPYKLLQKIGEGGMGAVYMAEQKEPFKRRVALKIIKPGMDSKQVIARFEAERQALAMMDHPNIAKVLDAGQTEHGQPYFVMELVNGISITKYCDEQHLTPKERLELFVPICEAVQHAHQKGVIHRDLKPSNVLIALYDSKPVPKVIDFGVAKATSQTLTEKTIFTQFGQVVGTLEYMSPEQAQRNQLDIDTRSDVYSLGVVLYELLTGDTPFDRRRLRSGAYDEVLRIIREEDPPKPSTRVSRSDSLPSIAANRQVEPKRLSSIVRGELDWIVMKAIEKDRGRRYETANAFAMDVRRYLDDEPVEAGPPSKTYRLRRFARKHKGLFATATAFVLLLVIASVISTWLAIRAGRAVAVAKLQRDTATAARDAASAARKETEAERNRTREALRESLLQQARALRRTTESGRRQRALNALAEAAKLGAGLDLRNEYLRCLDVADLVPAHDLPYPTIDDAFSKASRDRIQALQDAEARQPERQLLWSRGAAVLQDSRNRIVMIPSSGRPIELDRSTGEVMRLVVDIAEIKQPSVLSRDGRLLAARNGDDSETSIWDIEKGELLGELKGPDGKPVVPFLLAFDRGSKKLAVLSEQRVADRASILIYDVEPLHLLNTWEISQVYVDCVTFHPNGEILAASVATSPVHEVWLWSVSDGKQLVAMPVDQRGAWIVSAKPHRIDFSSDGRALVAGGQTGVVKAWDISALTADPGSRRTSQNVPREIFLTSLHAGRVPIVRLSHNGRWLASAGEDQTLRIWELSTGRMAAQAAINVTDGLQGTVSWSQSDDQLVCSTEKGLRLWQFVRPVSQIKQFGTPSEDIGVALEFSPKEDSLVLARDTTTHIISPLAAPSANADKIPGARVVAFSPDGSQLWGSRFSESWTWEIKRAGEARSESSRGQRTYAALGFNSTGNRIATGTESWVELTVFSLETGEQLWGETQISTILSSERGAAFSSDSSQFAYRFWSSEQVKHWESDTGTLVAEYRSPNASHLFFHADRLMAIERLMVKDMEGDEPLGLLSEAEIRPSGWLFSEDGKLGAAVVENRIMIWNLSDRSLNAAIERAGRPATFGPHGDLKAFDRSGTRFASYDGPDIKIWDASNGTGLAQCRSRAVAMGFGDMGGDDERLILVGPSRVVSSLSVAGDAPVQLCTLEADQNLSFDRRRAPRITAEGRRVVYLTDEDVPTVHVWDAQTGKQVTSFSVSLRSSRFDRDVSVSPDGKKIAILGEYHVQKVWDVDNDAVLLDFGQVPRSLRLQHQYVNLSAGCRRLAVAVPGPYRGDHRYDSDIEVHHLSTGEAVFDYASTNTTCLALADDGERLAVAEGKAIVVFDLSAEKRLGIKGHEADITDMTFDKSGQVLFSGSADDRTITLWSTNTGNERATFHTSHKDLAHVAISPNFDWLAVASSDGQIQLWSLQDVRGALQQVGLDWP